MINGRTVVAKFITKTARDFSCLQCNLPEPLASQIYHWGCDNITEDDLWPEEGRQEDIHVTVKYGIHTIDFTEARNLLMNQGPISITLGNVSLFEQPDHDVVKLDVTSPDLQKLNKIITGGLETTDKVPLYIPHVTIAYVRKGRGTHLVGREDFKGITVILTSAVFSGHDYRKTLLHFVPPYPQERVSIPPLS